MKPDEQTSRVPEISAAKTSRQQEISSALQIAYAHAAQLKIKPAEASKLQKPFPDSVVEIINHAEGSSLYLPHVEIETRLCQVFGPGGWNLICRDHAAEYEQRIRAEYVLVIRGCAVGETLEEAPVNLLKPGGYLVALKFTEAKALRRICATRLNCGSQIYKKDFCERWMKKFAESVALEKGGTAWRKKGSKLSLDESDEMPVSQSQRPKADENLRGVMLQCLTATSTAENVLKFAVAEGILKEGQPLEDWPLSEVAITESEIRKLQIKIQDHFAPAKEAINWKTFEVPFGGLIGKKLGNVEKEAVAELWAGFQDPKMAGAAKKHSQFKIALDEAAAHYGFSGLKNANADPK